MKRKAQILQLEDLPIWKFKEKTVSSVKMSEYLPIQISTTKMPLIHILQ